MNSPFCYDPLKQEAEIFAEGKEFYEVFRKAEGEKLGLYRTL